MFTHTQLTFSLLSLILLTSTGHFDLQQSLNKPRKHQNGHVFDLQVAVCVLCIAWILTRGSGFPMPKLYRRASGCVSQSHDAVSRDSEGAGLWLLPAVCQAGRGALWSVHAEVLGRPEVLPKHRVRITIATAHPRFRTMWTTSGLGCHDKSGPAGYE